MNLTKNFELWEFEVSQTAKRMGIENKAPDEAITNLRRLAECLQRIRDKVDAPIIITSGYRNKAVNKAVGGVEPSSHESGLAADIIIAGLTPLQTCLACMRHARYYDRIIWEFDGWCHFQIGESATYSDNAFKNITIDKNGTRWGFVR